MLYRFPSLSVRSAAGFPLAPSVLGSAAASPCPTLSSPCSRCRSHSCHRVLGSALSPSCCIATAADVALEAGEFRSCSFSTTVVISAGKGIMSKDKFDNLKKNLMCEGSSVLMLSVFLSFTLIFCSVVITFTRISISLLFPAPDKQRLLEPTMAYAASNPIMSDADFR